MSVKNGSLIYTQSQKAVHTEEGSKWIFVLSTSRNLYIGEKKKGQFQHSSFLAGGATIASGRLVALNGVLRVRHIYMFLLHNNIIEGKTQVDIYIYFDVSFIFFLICIFC